MKLISIIAAVSLLSTTACKAQIKNAKTESVKIYGNCGMCETSIEKAGNKKKVAKVDWNKDTKIATITYDAKMTNQDEILKRIALSGYDSEKFLAPNDVYAKLPGCCQYERKAQTVAKVEAPKKDSTKMEDHSAHNQSTMTETKKDVPQLKAVFDNYFAVKDALVKTDVTTTQLKATALLAVINAVKMETLKMDEHMVWMKVEKDLKMDAQHISESKDIAHQRDHFMSLSKNIYALIKVAKNTETVYYQFCPMANDGKGANWLSKESGVKNPYYGNQMLTCGKTVETIK